MSEVVELLRELVRADSQNPPGDERSVAEVARSYLDTVPGIVVEEVGVAPERPMLVGTLDSGTDGRTLILGGHLDTVPVGEGWTHDPFGGEVEDGRLYGRGASDMKGGIAGFLVALRALARSSERWRGRIVCHLVPDEEPGGRLGAEVLLRRGLLEANAAVIAEPSELAVYRAQKGNVFASLRLHGRAAHGSMPQRGDNAISKAARLVVDLEDRLAPRLAERRHELVGAATLSVGTIRGGRRTNVVPDECVVTVDRRVVPGERLDDVRRELEAFVGGRADVEYEHVGASFETPASHWLVEAGVHAVEEVRGRAVPVGGLVGSSDARFYADGAGIPTILVGPGSMDQAHVPDEWVDVGLLEQSVDVYRRLAHAVLGDPRT
jgi:succinyl-diaminopimelate desuccinylase